VTERRLTIARTLAEVTIGVMGSGTESHDDVAAEIGALLASLQVNVFPDSSFPSR